MIHLSIVAVGAFSQVATSNAPEVSRPARDLEAYLDTLEAQGKAEVEAAQTCEARRMRRSSCCRSR